MLTMLILVLLSLIKCYLIIGHECLGLTGDVGHDSLVELFDKHLVLPIDQQIESFHYKCISTGGNKVSLGLYRKDDFDPTIQTKEYSLDSVNLVCDSNYQNFFIMPPLPVLIAGSYTMIINWYDASNSGYVDFYREEYVGNDCYYDGNGGSSTFYPLPGVLDTNNFGGWPNSGNQWHICAHFQTIDVPTHDMITDFYWEPVFVVEGENITFFSNVSYGLPPFTYNWEFKKKGGAVVGSATTRSPIFMFDTEGQYVITLEVEDFYDNTDSKANDIEVEDSYPVANFEWDPIEQEEYLGVSFTSLSTGFDPIAEYEWNFNNEGSSTERNTTFIFNSDGLKDVSLLVRDNDGSEDSISKLISIVPSTYPLVDFIWEPENPIEGTPIQFIDKTTSLSNTIVKWEWSFGDFSSDLQNPVFTFEKMGKYDVLLTASDNEDKSTELIKQVTVSTSSVENSLLPILLGTMIPFGICLFILSVIVFFVVVIGFYRFVIWKRKRSLQERSDIREIEMWDGKTSGKDKKEENPNPNVEK